MYYNSTVPGYIFHCLMSILVCISRLDEDAFIGFLLNDEDHSFDQVEPVVIQMCI